MSGLEQIKTQVKRLNKDELRKFRDWFVHFDAQLWDGQFEADAKNDRFLELAEEALRDHGAGRSTIL